MNFARDRTPTQNERTGMQNDAPFWAVDACKSAFRHLGVPQLRPAILSDRELSDRQTWAWDRWMWFYDLPAETQWAWLWLGRSLVHHTRCACLVNARTLRTFSHAPVEGPASLHEGRGHVTLCAVLTSATDTRVFLVDTLTGSGAVLPRISVLEDARSRFGVFQLASAASASAAASAARPTRVACLRRAISDAAAAAASRWDIPGALAFWVSSERAPVRLGARLYEDGTLRVDAPAPYAGAFEWSSESEASLRDALSKMLDSGERVAHVVAECRLQYRPDRHKLEARTVGRSTHGKISSALELEDEIRTCLAEERTKGP